jgi:hypothetical protein
MHRGPRGDHPTTPVPVYRRRLRGPQENKTGRVSISGGRKGLAGRLGVTGGAFTPGQSSSGPLSNLPKTRPACAVRSEE